MDTKTIKDAREALDSMDDYARMAGIAPIGPLAVLTALIDAVEAEHPDTVRLDWFQKQIKRSSIRLPNFQFKSVNAWAISADGEDLRATIDSVMAHQKEAK